MSLIIALVGCNTNQNVNSEEDNESDKSYKELRNDFESSLLKKIKAPQYYSDFVAPPANISVMNYNSEGRELKGLLHTLNIDSAKETKAIVYLHGGFSLGYSDVSDCQPFIDAGYIVFAPSYRGENGNDGNFEYFYGEVSDAENAVKWLSSQSYVDSGNVFVFGHSIGGEMSTLLSLNNNCPSKLNGSSSGLYFKESLSQLVRKENIPFDTLNDNEFRFRCPVYMLNYLAKDHFMYIGTGDYYKESYSSIIEIYGTVPEKMKLIEMPGNHFSSLKPAMKSFLTEIEKIQKPL